MDTEDRSRDDLILPDPQWPSSVPGIEISGSSSQDNPAQKTAPSPPRHTWLTFLQKELEFLGVTQILISSVCLCLGTVICSMINISEFKEDIFSSFKARYPFWGAVFFAISGILSIVSEKNHKPYVLQGSLGANTISTLAAGAGIIILIINLKRNSAYINKCQGIESDDTCFLAPFSTEIVAIILFLTILEFCSAVLLIVYGVGELLERKKIPEDRLYEELNIYSPIYTELEDRGNKLSPTES
ncbi:PREDICTED: high affinity immunoglobulin epsilon receptor subunit beta [Condylura cristata]|uniref:high affinity immunoglobulin epsilon receptor subunit beta n=1 Tax=Condylura cristata TaxID=143302 RepID=UPI0003343C66|nr:PREDICTED: high affinity immunoglobulin epsilon receptor subunit beta [Condylura cristata]